MRINKFLAGAGISSRRNADKIVAEGRVKVNNKVITEMGYDINEINDTVTVDGKRVNYISKMTYVMLYKPKGCVCTASDEFNRKTIFNYVDLDKRLFSVGRLDYDSEGLLLLTNDGAITQKLTHPSNEIPKTYLVKVEGTVPENDLARIRKGITLDDGSLVRGKIKLKNIENNISAFEMTIYEGKNREIRRIFEAVGKDVVFLKRIKIGELRLGGLARGAYRYLTEREIEYLINL